MEQLAFSILALHQASPTEWLNHWSKVYVDSTTREDLDEYAELIKAHQHFEPTDFEKMGKWKDGGRHPNKWREEVASVAFSVWMRAAKDIPACPDSSGAQRFLEEWQTETYRCGMRKIRFGLSRATTLLHFLSGGEYPIYDSRVQAAFERLTLTRMRYEVPFYLERFVPFFNELAETCGTKHDVRKLDQALFTFGASNSHPFRQEDEKIRRK